MNEKAVKPGRLLVIHCFLVLAVSLLLNLTTLEQKDRAGYFYLIILFLIVNVGMLALLSMISYWMGNKEKGQLFLLAILCSSMMMLSVDLLFRIMK